jgi:hypothetical protein
MRTTLFMAAEHRCGAEQVSAYEMKAYRSHVDPDFPRGGAFTGPQSGAKPLSVDGLINVAARSTIRTGVT